jgi:hypothetical protein
MSESGGEDEDGGGGGERAKRLRVEREHKVSFGSDRAQALNLLASGVVLARWGVDTPDDKVRVDPHTPLAIPFSSAELNCCVVAIVKHTKGVVAEITGQILVDAAIAYLAPLVKLQPGRGALAREVSAPRPSGLGMGAAASASAGLILRPGLRARDDGSFVLEVTKGSVRSAFSSRSRTPRCAAACSRESSARRLARTSARTVTRRRSSPSSRSTSAARRSSSLARARRAGAGGVRGLLGRRLVRRAPAECERAAPRVCR